METVADRVRMRREELGLTQAELGERVGMTQQGIATLETRGTKKPRLARELARGLNVHLDWLMDGKLPKEIGESIGRIRERGDPAMIPIVGIVRKGGIVDYGGSPDELGQAPPLAGEEGVNWRALRVEGRSLYPVHRDGHLLYYRGVHAAPETAVGRECVVSVTDAGIVYVRFVFSGSQPNRWHLSNQGNEPLMDQVVEWVAPIEWTRS